jgi:transposase-like protein
MPLSRTVAPYSSAHRYHRQPIRGRRRHPPPFIPVTNPLERTFGETRRRIKVIGRVPGERSCLSLVWAVLDRAARGWRGVVMTPAAVRLLQELRRQLHHPARLEEVADQPVTPAA